MPDGESVGLSAGVSMGDEGGEVSPPVYRPGFGIKVRGPGINHQDWECRRTVERARWWMCQVTVVHYISRRSVHMAVAVRAGA